MGPGSNCALYPATIGLQKMPGSDIALLLMIAIRGVTSDPAWNWERESKAGFQVEMVENPR
jgi:hypothetical protein